MVIAMVAWIDDDGLEEAAGRLAAVDARIEGIRGLALADLASIGRWGDHGSTVTLLESACVTICEIVADHGTRCDIAADLDATAWLGVTGLPLTTDTNESDRITTSHDARIAELEEWLADLAAAPASAPVAIAMIALRVELREAREARLRALQDRIAVGIPGGPAPEYFALLASEVAREAQLLGFTSQDFQDAAAAMVRGDSPDDAGLDPLLFPAAYVEAHAQWAELRDRREQLGVEIWEAERRASDAMLQGLDDEATQAWSDYWDASDAWAEVDGEIDDRFADGVSWTFVRAAGHLSSTAMLDQTDRDRAIGEFLATAILDNSYDVADVRTAADRYLRNEERAVTFFNTLPGDVVGILPYLDQGHITDRIEFMEPFAQALAMASHSSDLDLTAAEFVGDHLDGDSGLWFLTGGYDSGFLIDVAVAQTNVSGDDSYHVFPYGPMGDQWGYIDPRVLVADQIAQHGHEPSVALITELAAADLLTAYLRPAAGHEDNGVAVGMVVSHLGGGSIDHETGTIVFDADTAALMVEVLDVIGAGRTQDGILVGASQMIGPHLPSLLTPTQAGDLTQTPLAELVGPDTPVVQAFLTEIMGHQPSAEVVFAAATMHLAVTLTQQMDVGDPSSINPTTTGFGNLMDLVLSTYLDEGLSDAERQDRINGIISNVVGTVIDVGVGAGLAYAATISAPAWVALAAAGTVGNVGGAAFTNIVIPELTDFGLSTDNVEGVLESGYSIENAYVNETRLLVFGALADAGVVELPPAWYAEDGSLRTITVAEWDAFEDHLAVQLPDGEFYDWIAGTDLVGGRIDWDPND